MSDFHFLRPWWLLAIFPLIGLVWTLARRRASAGDWADYCDAALLPHILINTDSRQSRQPLWLAGATGLLAIFALAGPAWERLPSPVFRNLSAMVIVLDLSWAMEATDVKPNRLERARYKIDDLLRSRKDGQSALVAYAGDAFVVTPLTDDVATITAQLTALSPRIMPVHGTRMDLGIAAAARLLQQAGQKSGDVLVITAGEAVASAKSEAARLKDLGYRVSAIGIGSRDGAPIPLPDGGFLKDKQGRMLISRLDIKALWDFAQAGGGVYRTLDAGSADTDAVLEFVERRAEAANQAGQDVHVDQWQEGGIWLLPPLVLLSALAFRRGWLGLILFAVLAPVPQSADALEWRDLWLTPDQQAQRALQSGDAKAAAERFEHPAWKAAAEYKSGNFEQAAKSLESMDTAPAHYNRGNALAQQGQLEPALKAYDRALQLAPKDEDAEYNRKLVEEALKKKQEQQQKTEEKSDPSEGPDKGDKLQESQGDKDSQPSPPEQQDHREKMPEPPPSPKNQEGEQQQDQKPSQDAGQPPENRKGDAEQPDQAGDESQKPEEQHSAQPEQNDQKPEFSESQAGESHTEADQPGDKTPQAVEAETRHEDEQAEAQWLRRIPDDPGGLLKRKFSYQYRLRQQQQQAE